MKTKTVTEKTCEDCPRRSGCLDLCPAMAAVVAAEEGPNVSVGAVRMSDMSVRAVHALSGMLMGDTRALDAHRGRRNKKATRGQGA